MKQSKFTEEQIAYALRQVESGRPPADVCRQIGVSQGDVTDSQSVHRLLATAVERFGRLDVLVNNAGTALARLLDDVDDAHVAELFSVDVR